ncbi:MAG: SDR family NAD(P)-dependent oxidoreductase [Puniceicoccales bacterium]|jgi:short-subunit dehydrogenase|nr:SDR family NAD(P)-dependent oxidoreductase [Puniceicoccales bacterium]
MPPPFPYHEALVTGASRGLGRAFAEALHAEGVTVWGTSRDGTGLPEGIRPLALDLDTPATIAAAIAHLHANAPHLDLLINNAGAGAFHLFHEFPPRTLAQQWRTLLAAPVAFCHAFYPRFLEQEHGAIVNVTSLASQFPIPCMSAYSAAKAGLSTFTQALMLEAHGTGVAVIDFQPGDYATDFNNAMTAPAPQGDGTDADGTDATAARIWARCERHLHAGPPPAHAARRLLRALRRRRSQTVHTGTFWQARLGPLVARLLPRGIVQRYLRNYYDI